MTRFWCRYISCAIVENRYVVDYLHVEGRTRCLFVPPGLGTELMFPKGYDLSGTLGWGPWLSRTCQAIFFWLETNYTLFPMPLQSFYWPHSFSITFLDIKVLIKQYQNSSFPVVILLSFPASSPLHFSLFFFFNRIIWGLSLVFPLCVVLCGVTVS